jgi:hypothetical protein
MGGADFGLTLCVPVARPSAWGSPQARAVRPGKGDAQLCRDTDRPSAATPSLVLLATRAGGRFLRRLLRSFRAAHSAQPGTLGGLGLGPCRVCSNLGQARRGREGGATFVGPPFSVLGSSVFRTIHVAM